MDTTTQPPSRCLHPACSGADEDDFEGPSGIMITLEAHREEVQCWKDRLIALEMYQSDPLSTVTADLCGQLAHRDAMGRRKYHHSLDRRDLTLEEWAEHAKQEALDQACYLERVRRGAELLDEARSIMQSLASERDWDCAKQWLQKYDAQFERPNKVISETHEI